MKRPTPSLFLKAIPGLLGNAQGFTLLELLVAGVLTLAFFGWLTYAYYTVTRAVLIWHMDWLVAAETLQGLETLVRDLAEARTLQGLQEESLFLIDSRGRSVVYRQRTSRLYRNHRLLGGGGVVLQLVALEGLAEGDRPAVEALDETTPELRHANRKGFVWGLEPEEVDWVRVRLMGVKKDRTFTAETVVRLHGKRPQLIQEVVSLVP